GASIDYVDSAYGSGFKIDNPNPLWTDPTAQAVQKVLDDEINPAVASHGGHVALLEVKNDIAYIQLGGGCQGCGMGGVTLKQGVGGRGGRGGGSRGAVPSTGEIVDPPDHAGGKNPYYQPSRGGGRSPYAGARPPQRGSARPDRSPRPMATSLAHAIAPASRAP